MTSYSFRVSMEPQGTTTSSLAAWKSGAQAEHFGPPKIFSYSFLATTTSFLSLSIYCDSHNANNNNVTVENER